MLVGSLSKARRRFSKSLAPAEAVCVCGGGEVCVWGGGEVCVCVCVCVLCLFVCGVGWCVHIKGCNIQPYCNGS